MAQLIPPILASAFERMGSGNKSLEQVAINTGQTAAAVSVGGDLYEKMDELVKALKSGEKGKGGVSAKEALVLRITAGALKPIGLGLGVIIDALDRAPDGKELKLKMEALTNGLLSLADIGYSILKFAATMILATPLLLLAGIGAIIWVPLLKLMIQGLLWATEKLDKKALKKILVLGDVGKALLIMSGSLVLMSLLAPYILKGLLVAGAILLGFGLLGMLLDKMKIGKSLNKMAKTLKTLSLALLGLSVGLILIGLLTEPILYGLATASLIILTLAGVFWLIDRMKVGKAMRKTSRALIAASMAILSVAVSLVLSSLIISTLGWDEVGKVLLLVGAVAFAFWSMNKILGKGMKKGAMGLIFAAGAILSVAVAIFLAKLLIGPVDAENALQTFGVLVVLGAVAAVFALAGVGEKFIKKGAIAMAIAGGAMIVIAIGVYAMKKAIDGLSWGNLGMMAAVIVGLAVAMGIAGAGPIPGFIALGSAAMIVAGLALIVIGAGVAVLSKATEELTLDKLLVMGGVIAGLAIAMGIAGAGPLPAFIALGSAAMMVAGIALLPIALGVAAFAKATEELTLDKILVMGGVIAGIAVAMAAAGVASPFILLGSAAMLVAGVATLAIGLGLLAISKLDFAALGSIDKKGNKPFNFSGEKGFFGGKKTNFEVAMDAIADGMSLGPLSIAGIAMGAPMLILAGAALVGIVAGIRAFSGIAEEADLPGLKQNVSYIVGGLADTFAEVGKKYPGGGSSLLSALTGNTSGQSVVAMGISAVGGMGKALTGIAKGVQAMASLKFPTGFDKDGNPTGYETIDVGTVVPGLIANTQLLVSGLSSVFAEVGESEAAQGSSWFSSSTYEKGINVVKQMGTPLYNLANGVQAMANLKFPTGYDKDGNPTGFKSIGNVGTLVQKLSNNTKALIKGLAGVFEEVGKSGIGEDGGWFSSSSFDKGVEIAMQLGEPYTTLASVVDNVVKITSKITDAQDVKTKVTAIISAVTDTGGDDTGIINAKKNLIATIGSTYAKLGTAIPQIVNAIASFTVDKAKSFASIFGGESPAELFESKTKFLRGLTLSYMRMAIAIPMIIGSINTVRAKQLDEFTAIYGGQTNVATEVLNSRSKLFLAVGIGYEKMGKGALAISGAINGTNIKTLEAFKGMFVGKVHRRRPVAGYEAQSELWKSIGVSMKTSGTVFPTISSAINSMDLAKLTEARTMFEALAVLSKGGSPSDVLSQMGESLEDALDNLAEMLENFRSTVEEGNEQNTGIIEKVGNAVSNMFGSNSGGSSSSPAPKINFPSKMVVSLDRKSIDAIKEDGLGGGR